MKDAHVYPFDTKFYRKVHSAGALLFSGVHSYLMLMQYLFIYSQCKDSNLGDF